MFEIVEKASGGTGIKVIGVGGAGGNAVDHMIREGVQGVDFITANTEAPDHWQRFGSVRALVGACIQLGSFFRKRFGLGPAILLFIPYTLISAQNAYMWSYMDADTFRDHTLAYAIFLGGSMIALWTVRWSVWVLVVSVAANIWFLSTQSPLSFSELMANGGNLMITVALIATLMVHNRYQVSKRELILREQLEKATVEAREQRAVIEAAHQDLTASIRYSQRIQQAVLPKADRLTGHVAEHFVLHPPRTSSVVTSTGARISKGVR